MIINIPTEVLDKPMRILSSVSDAKQTMPILGNTLFKLSGGSLELIASDLEVEVRYLSSEVGVDGEVSSTIPTKKFSDILKVLGGSNASLEFDEKSVEIKGGTSKFKVSTLPVDDFPLSEFDSSDRFSVKPSDLLEMIDNTSFSMGYQDARHFLNGLYFEPTDSGMIAVATDGHRLAYCEITSNDGKFTTSCIVPRKGIVELKKILGLFTENKDILAEVSINNKNLTVFIGNYSLTTKLIEGNYPDYKKVFPESLPNTLVLSREDLRTALQKMAILSSEQYKGVKLGLEPTSLHLSTTNPQQEKGEDTIDCTYEGDPMSVGFNLAYIMEVIDAIDTEQVKFRFGSPDSGCLVSANSNNPSSKYIIMPMRV